MTTSDLIRLEDEDVFDTTSDCSRRRVEGLDRLRGRAHDGPSPKATAAQHARGKLTARERIDHLLDPSTFTELETFRTHRATRFGMEHKRPHGDGVVTGWGTIEGRKVFLYAHDFRVFGGSLGEAHAQKIQKVIDLAVRTGCPVIGLNDGAGARIQEGVTALDGFGGIFRRISAASGVVPQISVMLGPCAGGAAYAPALTDFIFMVEGTSQMVLTGPDVVRSVTGEEVSLEELGGAAVHTSQTGVAHFSYPDERECLDEVRYLVQILPSNNRTGTPRFSGPDVGPRSTPGLLDLVPVDGRKAYDVRDLIEDVVDDGDFTEVHRDWARNLVCGFGHLGGELVGFVANQPIWLSGVLDISASEKGARFVQFCDAFDIPLITLVDVPGFLPGSSQENGGVIRHGAKLLYAYCTATCPRITLITRKSYGGAYIVMNSSAIGADLTLAWPTNEVAVMGAEGATDLVFRKEIKASTDPEATRAMLRDRYRQELMNPYHGAEVGVIDEIIDPCDTRNALVDGLRMLSGKREALPDRRHGNPPQ